MSSMKASLSLLEHSGTIAGAAALVIGSCLSLMQLDLVSRRILSPESLRLRRRLEQRHRLEQAIADQILRIQETIIPTRVEVITDPLEIQDLVQVLISNQSKQKVILVGIATDTSVGTSFEEWYLHLVLVNDESSSASPSITMGRRIQVPLVPFAIQLADAFDDKVTGTALCFIADASSGLGSHALTQIAQKCDLCVIQEPSWMTTLAYIAQQNLITTLKLQRIVYALCRLQAWMVARDLVGAAKTLVFTLPGQSSTAQLLPLLHHAFPCERHVFVYDGCVDSVVRGLCWTEKDRWNSKETAVPTQMPHSITATIPISPLVNQTSMSQSLYTVALSRLPSTLASIVEAWMSSVDTFLTLKSQQQPIVSKDKDRQMETNRSEEYLPFVCRLGILLGQTGRLGNGDQDLSELAVVNVLQYMTGSRSRPLPDTVVSKAFSALHELQQYMNTWEIAQSTRMSPLKSSYSLAIESCVFNHKNILIGDKTLMDTVQPMKEWTLLAAKKVSGCSCCLPSGDDEEDEVEGKDSSLFKSPSTIPASSRSNYVDGKTGFAFDPTRFTSGA